VPRRVAIDAINFVRDRRGMGRLARPVLRAAREDDRFEVTLLADKPGDRRALRTEFPGASLRSTASARRAGRYDVVWFPFNGMRYSVAAPALVAINDAFAFTQAHPERIARLREQSPIRRAAREASRIVTISKWSRSEIARELGLSLERIEVIVPAPDPFWYPGNGDVLPDALEGSRFALLVGAGEARKNVRLALEACARAFDRPDELLAIVGRLNDDDRAFAHSLGLRAGEISASDPMLRALYRRASVVLVPSFAEGFGLVAVEALACGAPVLAADAAALPEATAGAATLLDPSDTAAWARAIRSLFDDESAAAAARAGAIARFASIDRNAPVRRTLALLDEIAIRGG
jgi:glycosyltransferase involved in cell wall biosynthesis